MTERGDRRRVSMSPEWPQLPANAVPSVTAEEMRDVDAAMTRGFGIDLVQMMELAGFHLAELAVSLAATAASITVLSGSGNNGGGGLVCARHLANRGYTPRVIFDRDLHELPEVTARQAHALTRIGVELSRRDLAPTDLVIDALIGYGLKGAPAGRARQLIDAANRCDAPTLSLDVPSGLDPSTGRPSPACIEADATLTLALPKTGLLTVQARRFVGRLFLAEDRKSVV